MGITVQAVTATAGVLAVSVAIGAQAPVTHRFTPERFYNTFRSRIRRRWDQARRPGRDEDH